MKTILHCSALMTLCLLVLWLNGCNAATAGLLGTYAIEQDGKTREFLRIEKRGEKFVIIEKDRRKWLAPAEAEEVGDTDLERILGQNIPDGYVALGNEMVAVLQVRKGWKLGAFESRTGYVLASSLGPMDLYPEQTK